MVENRREIETPDDPEPQHLIGLLYGKRLEENGYSLSWNDDRQGRWWLKKKNESSTLIVTFHTVDKAGEDSYFLVEKGDSNARIEGIDNAAPNIAAVLHALACFE